MSTQPRPSTYAPWAPTPDRHDGPGAPEDARAVLDAFRRFAHPGATALTKHQLKCAYAAVLGAKPHKAQVDLMFARHADQLQDGMIPFEAYCMSMQVGAPCSAQGVVRGWGW